jgi:hypothetical protein
VNPGRMARGARRVRNVRGQAARERSWSEYGISTMPIVSVIETAVEVQIVGRAGEASIGPAARRGRRERALAARHQGAA